MITYDQLKNLAQTVLDSSISPGTKQVWRGYAKDFLQWYTTTGQQTLTRTVTLDYRQNLLRRSISDTTINPRVAFVKKIAREASFVGLISSSDLTAIEVISGIPKRGRRLGQWLTESQAQELINAPDSQTLIGLRDRAILSILLGAGLRRHECQGLTLDQFQRRQGRWVIVDIAGKGHKARSVPIADWVYQAVIAYVDAMTIKGSPLFRGFDRAKRCWKKIPLSYASYYFIVQRYGDQIGVDLAPHDLRRTYAKLGYDKGVPLEQIRICLGHENLNTTQLYIGSFLNLTRSPSDYLEISLDP